MANDHGLLPKASREDLDDRLRARLDRWYQHAYEDDNMYLTFARRPGLLDALWGFLTYIYGGGSSIDPDLAELVRIRLAWNNQCTHCSIVRSGTAAERGATPDVVEQLKTYSASDLPEHVKVAMRLADTLSLDQPPSVSPELYAQLLEHYSEDQILDMGMIAAFFTGWQRFNEAFGIVPDSWREDGPKPWDSLVDTAPDLS